jgi:hypothetical protein
MVKETENGAASCLNCRALEKCKLRDNILHETLRFANYGEEGCVRYQGDGMQEGGHMFNLILNHLKNGQIINERIALQRYSCAAKKLHDNIARTAKYQNIKTIEKDGEVFYMLIPSLIPKVKKLKSTSRKVITHELPTTKAKKDESKKSA